MRWDHLRLVAEGEGGAGPAPLIERGAVARTFDTPEFRGMTFYEVHARTVINRVPAASRVPFRWTVNPYRGCSHACSYCLAGETPILMADGRTRPLQDLRPGDRVCGTGRADASAAGAGRRLVVTEVLDHWRTFKPAYRVVLGDGTELVASGDHRFLTERGWRHVAAHAGGRPAPGRALEAGDRLMGVGGGFAEPPKDDADYRRGYLCAMVRCGAGRGHVLHRVAACQEPVRERTLAYLTDLGGAPAGEAARWPRSPSGSWLKGFVAGALDTGALDTGALGGSPEPGGAAGDLSPAVRAHIRLGLEHLGLTAHVSMRLRLAVAVDPACARTPEGMRLGPAEATRVVSVEALGVETPLYDITTGTGDFVASGVVSHNCFARKTHEYLDLDSGADFDSKIVVKVNAAERVRRELAAPRWRGEHIAMGTNVDCYQRAEGRYRLMPGILEALRDAANPFSILTKGALILRDLPLLLEARERTEVGTAVSVGFVDRALGRLVEPGAPAPARRLEVCAALNEAGIGCGVLMGPVLPYLTDSPRQLEAAVRQIAEAGATSVSAITLHLRPGAREWFLAWLREHHPELVVPYARLYGNRAYAPREFQERISARVRDLAERHGIGRRPSPPTPSPPRGTHPPPPPEPEQLTLPTP
ncbi:intein-containing Rv2578c family radical SAM protein [Actinomadura rugatobispora]|uniref:Intein-containing Rv2578c family radical SAM protein n=1 Tax=Actinomadura rugatobispora TaxID=1994 RepID=A0ABW0ZSA4_9ACTN